MTSNLPPGVSDSDIPGNRPEDITWEKVRKQIDEDATTFAMTPEDAAKVWSLGIPEWQWGVVERQAGHNEGMTEAADILEELGQHAEAELIRPTNRIRLRYRKELP